MRVRRLCGIWFDETGDREKLEIGDLKDQSFVDLELEFIDHTIDEVGIPRAAGTMRADEKKRKSPRAKPVSDEKELEIPEIDEKPSHREFITAPALLSRWDEEYMATKEEAVPVKAAAPAPANRFEALSEA